MTDTPRINHCEPVYLPDGHWIDKDGDEVYIKNSKLHRTDGPAVIQKDGTREWYVNDEYHRTDGPAVIWADGEVEWWLNDQCYSFGRWLRANDYITDEQKVMLKLEYG